jgi:hypothetical protein
MKSSLGFLVLMSSVVFGAANGYAAEKQFGDWAVGVLEDKTATYAATVNDSGALLSEVCLLESGTCFWVLVMDIRCEGDHQFPLLGSTASGATSLTVTCGGAAEKSKGTYRYVFTDWKNFESLIEDSRLVSFAFPLESEQFRVVRFSLSGRADAMALAEAAAHPEDEDKGSRRRNRKVSTLNSTL